MRAALLLAAALVTVFGGLCLNYTTDENADHHREMALEKGWPAPGNGIYLLGIATLAGGAGGVGFLLGRRAPSKR